jgi:MFS superfamily sulfate permease-like transporter
LFILVPTGCLTGIGVILLLGQHAGVTWAEDFRQSFRHTVLWHLAFWEWIGVGLGYVFMALSVLLLPTSDGERRPRSGRAS